MIAIIMGASIPSAMLNVSLDINEKIGAEFRKFGANLLVVPKSDTIEIGIGDISLSSVKDQQYINESDIYKIKTINWSKNVFGYAPFLYQVVSAKAKTNGEEQQVVLTGTWFEKNISLEEGEIFTTGVRKINSWWWNVEGEWIEDIETISDTIYCMIGKSVAEKLSLNLGDEIEVTYRETVQETTKNLTVVGIITSGGSEDNHIFVPLLVAQSLTNRENRVHTVQVSALCIGCPIETIADEIETKISYIEAKTILQMTNAEMNVLEKIQMMLALITIIALLATILGVSTTLTTSVLERRTEIGLMKSIGAEDRKIGALFFAESSIIGLLGGFFGFLIGIVGAQFVGILVFDSLVTPQVIVLPIVLGISLLVSLLASLVPVKRAMGIEPMIVLRGL
ncbi:MAG: ABC transporter permease [Candidatus Heimdallarchaeota archaeon]|nr:MAG: ABC transporter permease [Candidatus Heimdallarchaeota archaeon]